MPRGGYDAGAKVGNMSLNIGAPVGNGRAMVGATATPGMMGFNVQAIQALNNGGAIGFRGIYTKNSLGDFMALGLDAQLNNTPIGAIRIIGDYSKAGPYRTASLGIGKAAGPGRTQPEPWQLGDAGRCPARGAIFLLLELLTPPRPVVSAVFN